MFDNRMSWHVLLSVAAVLLLVVAFTGTGAAATNIGTVFLYQDISSDQLPGTTSASEGKSVASGVVNDAVAGANAGGLMLAVPSSVEMVMATAMPTNAIGVNYLPNTAGNYYLTADIYTDSTWVIPQGVTNFDLNGHSIIYTTGQWEAVYISSGSTLNLYDNSVAGNGVITGGRITEEYNGGGVYVDGTFNMYGGNIVQNAGRWGGGVYIRNGTFTMYGGAIAENAANFGGGVYVGSNGNFELRGGEIVLNYAETSGGGVYVDSTLFTQSNGYIAGNMANYGGGVYVYGGEFILNGGSVADNIAENDAGGILLSMSTFTQSSGSITNNTAYYGGGVEAFSSECTLSGGDINENTASVSGGGVYAGEASTIILNGGQLTQNRAQYGGCIYLADYSELTITGGSINDNIANYGGGVYSNGSIVMLNGGSIAENIAGIAGGIYAIDSIFDLVRGDIAGNIAAIFGGGCFENSEVTISGGSVSDNVATNEITLDGISSSTCGGLFVAYGSTIISGGTVTNNSAANIAGMIVQDGTLSMTGGSIIENHASEMYGGLIVSNATFTLSGGQVTGNSDSVSSSNIVLEDAIITIDSRGILSDSQFGITTEPAPMNDNPVAFTGVNNRDYSSYFTADPTNSRIENRNNVLYLVSDSEAIITASVEKSAYLIGEDVVFSGTSTASPIYAYISGANKQFQPLNANYGAASTNAISVVNEDWTYTVDGDVFFRGDVFDAGTYNVYFSETQGASSLAELNGFVRLSIVLKQPFIVVTSAPSVVEKGSNYVVSGIATGTKSVSVYLFSTNGFVEGKIPVNDDDTFSFEYDTSEMGVGQSFVIVQHPMYDGFFNIANVGPNFYQNLEGDAGKDPAKDTLLFNMSKLTMTQGLRNLTDALENPDIDDMYVKFSFSVVDPTPPPTPVTPSIPTSISLKTGWNFISVPTHLDTSCDTAGELFAGLKTVGTAMLGYDPQGGWYTLSRDTKIKPLDGYWVYAAEEKTINLVYSSEVKLPPTKSVSKGWNAVGICAEEPISALSAFKGISWQRYLPWNVNSGGWDSIIVNGDSKLNLLNGGWLYLEEDGNYVGSAATPVGKRPTYVVGIDAEYPPFTYIDSMGKPAGFDVESIQLIAKQKGFDVKIQPVAWDGIVYVLDSGSIDMIYSGMSITKDRAERVAFSNPYWTIGPSVVVRTGSSITMNQFNSGDVTIGVPRECSAIEWLKEHFGPNYQTMVGNKIKLYDSFSQTMVALENGLVDTVIFDDTGINQYILGKDNFTKLGMTDGVEYFAVAVRKSDTELLSLINEGLSDLMASDDWYRLMIKYELI